jgi:predicted ABC-type ATPase
MRDGDGDGRCQERGGRWIPCPPSVKPGTTLGGHQSLPAGLRITLGKFNLDLKSMLTRPVETSSAFGGRYPLERKQEVHDPIIDALTQGVPKSGRKTLFFMGGHPGSGKSTLLKSGKLTVPDNKKAAHLDPDEIKELIPEYQQWVAEGVSTAAMLVHEESNDILNEASKRAINAEQDVVLDTLGNGYFEKVRDRLNWFRSKGYRVVGNYTTRDLQESIKGVRERADFTGRRVPNWIVETVAGDIPGITWKALQDGLFDEFTLWDMDKMGSPVAIAKWENEALTIINKERYAKWRSGKG